MLDVLIGQAYFLRFDAKMWAAQQPYPPLGALYAAAVVRGRGRTVGLFDAMLANSEEEWSAALDRERPRIAVLFEDNFNYLTKMCLLRMREAAFAMIAAAGARGIPVLVAGSDASDHPSLYLDRGATAVVVGEGEITLAEAVDALLSEGVSLASVRGLALSSSSGSTVRTAPRAFVRDLDELPRPAWNLVDVERYRTIWRERHGYFSMHISTTRGCPYHCNWCAKPIYGQRYAVRSPEAVVDEIAWLKDTYHPDHLWITDDIFGLKPGWIERFGALMAERQVAIPFKCLLRADGVTPAVAQALHRAGCQTVWVGAESGSQRVLDAMEKGIAVADIESAIGLLHAARIEVGFFLQFGYPGETIEDIALTREMVARCAPDDIGISVSYPLPGTTFHQRVSHELGGKQNWTDSADLALMYRGPYPPEFYRVLHTVVHIEFRLRRLHQRMTTVRSDPRLASLADARSVVQNLVSAAKLPALWWRLRHLSKNGAAPAPPLLNTHALLPMVDQRPTAVAGERRP